MSEWVVGYLYGLLIVIVIGVFAAGMILVVTKFDWILPLFLAVLILIGLPLAIACGPLGVCP
jgi:hypothetical protein